MAIKEIKSKINDNKQEKERKLLNTALHLFSEKGIKKTSIQDIVKDAGIAKGTFYLYFKDKYELQDVLLAKTSHELFSKACKEATQQQFDRLDDKIVFIIDSIINELIVRPNILKFIQKNLSLGLYSEKLTDLLDSEELGIKELFVNEVKEKDIWNRTKYKQVPNHSVAALILKNIPLFGKRHWIFMKKQFDCGIIN